MAQELSEVTRTLVRSRIPKYETLAPDEAAKAAIKVIAADFYIYCERNLMIKDKRGQMVPLVPNWAQRILVERVLKDLHDGVPVRYIILKARQMGLSTIIEALCFWWTTTHKNVNSVIIGHKKKAAKNLYKMFRRFYDNAHQYFRPTRKYNTKDDLTFDITDDVKENYISQGLTANEMPGLGSEIQTMVAGEGEGRSDTILFFHGSEVAFWDKGSDVLSSALQAIPLFPETFAFLESTANGVGGYFYDEWQFAKKGESAFKPLFFAWHEHPEYMIPGKIAVYDEEEQELLEIFEKLGYAKDTWDPKLVWRREKRKEFRSEPDKFYQEYPKDDMEAFLASGRPVFDIRKLIKMEELARLEQNAPTFGIVKLIPNSETGIPKYGFERVPRLSDIDEPTPLKVWELPVKGIKYTIGVDVADGLEKGTGEKDQTDFSVVDVMRTDTLKTVARYRAHIDPDQLGEVVYDLGTYYNFALVGVEVNNHGISTVQTLRNKFYRNLYQRETSEDEQFQERTTRMGWLTNKKTKPVAINELVKAIREGDIIDYDVVFIREAMTYVRDDNGKTSAQENMFDDCIMAKAINLQMSAWNSYDLSNVNIYKPQKRTNGQTKTTSNREALSRRKQARREHRAAAKQ
jgi:hypothetical protein